LIDPLRVDQAILDGLFEQEPAFREVVERLGAPPIWHRPAGFATLVLMILEQQVSIASARAAFGRLEAFLGDKGVTPQAFLSICDQDLLRIGFSRQKKGYCRGLAQDLLAGRLNLMGLGELEDDEVRRKLMAVRGIGPWTAEVYLTMALLRPDAFPAGDIALQEGARRLFGLRERPDTEELRRMAEAWRPYRAIAARLLWHHYLNPVPKP